MRGARSYTSISPTWYQPHCHHASSVPASDTFASPSTPAAAASMSGSSLETPARPSRRRETVAVVAAYATLGVALLWSRLAYLGHSFWTDEILMVQRFVRPGLKEILTGAGLTHQ